MKRRTLKSYRPDVGLYLCSNAGRIWYEVMIENYAPYWFTSITKARDFIRYRFGPELKKENET